MPQATIQNSAFKVAVKRVLIVQEKTFREDLQEQMRFEPG